MSGIDKEDVLRALSAVFDPDKERDIVSLGMVSGLQVKDGHVAFAIEVEAERGPRLEPLRKAAETAVWAMDGVLTVSVALTAERPAAMVPPARSATQQGSVRPGPGGNPALLPGVRAIVAVASGKGGVGKSTTSVNLALALKTIGLRVGLLDADVYGPSIPRLMGIKGKPISADGRRLQPMENFGIKCMSMGFLVDEETPVVWRGPMVMSALEQMMRDVDWGELDVLVVDMPPGTGDTQLTMSQRVPLAGAIIVSTPQDIALADARKGLAMFRKVEVPLLGIVENMSYFLCPDNGKRYDIFGHGGAKQEALRQNVPFLGEIPLDMDIRKTSDSGQPIVVSRPEGVHAQTYIAIARMVWAQVAARLSDAHGQGPRIVVQ